MAKNALKTLPAPGINIPGLQRRGQRAAGITLVATIAEPALAFQGAQLRKPLEHLLRAEGTSVEFPNAR